MSRRTNKEIALMRLITPTMEMVGRSLFLYFADDDQTLISHEVQVFVNIAVASLFRNLATLTKWGERNK